MGGRDPILHVRPRLRPWLGFGRAGWIASVLLAALALAVAVGWDPYMRSLELVARLFGADAVSWYALFAAVYPRLALGSIQASAITAFAGSIALWILPGRFPWGRLAVLWLGCLVVSSFGGMPYSNWLRPWFGWGQVRHAAWTTNPGAAVVVLLASVAIVRIGANSRLAALVALLAGLTGIAWDEYAMATSRPALPISTATAWQWIVAVSMVGDALRRRGRAPDGEGPWCAACLHSLAGGRQARCPECGAAFTPDRATEAVPPSRSPPARMR